jgi:hypothetical protein
MAFNSSALLDDDDDDDDVLATVADVSIVSHVGFVDSIVFDG